MSGLKSGIKNARVSNSLSSEGVKKSRNHVGPTYVASQDDSDDDGPSARGLSRGSDRSRGGSGSLKARDLIALTSVCKDEEDCDLTKRDPDLKKLLPISKNEIAIFESAIPSRKREIALGNREIYFRQKGIALAAKGIFLR